MVSRSLPVLGQTPPSRDRDRQTDRQRHVRSGLATIFAFFVFSRVPIYLFFSAQERWGKEQERQER